MVSFIKEHYREFVFISISLTLKLSYTQLHSPKLINIQKIYRIFTSTILY
jgi:hypothetical protein